MTSNVHLRTANLDDIDTVVALFREYAGGIGIDLSYQGFEDELESLPGAYAPPRGTLLLAEIAGEAMGCVAVRPIHAETYCEMKRLYVRDAARGTGAGRAPRRGRDRRRPAHGIFCNAPSTRCPP